MKSKKPKIAIVVSQFNSTITNRLLQCALAELKSHKIPKENVTIIRVPGAYELPFFANELAITKKYQAIIALGCIIKGETSHDVHIAQWVSTGLGMASLQHRVPILFGVLTPNSESQGMSRSRPGPLNRGKEVAQAALQIIHLRQGKGA